MQEAKVIRLAHNVTAFNFLTGGQWEKSKGTGDGQVSSETEFAKNGGFTPEQVEVLFNLFKEGENKERMDGK